MGFSTGRGEVVRYIGRHGTTQLTRVSLISAVPFAPHRSFMGIQPIESLMAQELFACDDVPQHNSAAECSYEMDVEPQFYIHFIAALSNTVEI